MTKEEAKKILEAYIACESKKAHFECSEYNCDDSCPLLYDMGTVGEYNEAINIAIQALEQEPKTGHWIKKGNTLKCPLCGAKGEDIKDDYCFNYCPNCGAKMVEPQKRSE